MANVSSYTFDNMSRIGLDSCCIDQDTIQNTASCNYMTQNYFASNCSMKNQIDFRSLRKSRYLTLPSLKVTQQF